MTDADREKLEALVLRIDQTSAQAWMIALALGTMDVGAACVDAVVGVEETLKEIAGQLNAMASAPAQ